MTKIAITKTVDLSFGAAVEKAIEELQKEGFGVLTTIDFQAKMKEKLDLDMEPYVILGACNPALAWDAVSAFPELGVLLPCNVVVRESGGQTIVSAMDPAAALGLIDNSIVHKVGEDAASRLRRVIAAM
jgi:uncharacterized protein (DUF302 family)